MDPTSTRIRVSYIPQAWTEVQHAVADYLSGVRDEFLDAQLFKITVEEAIDALVPVEDKWMTDMQ